MSALPNLNEATSKKLRTALAIRVTDHMRECKKCGTGIVTTCNEARQMLERYEEMRLLHEMLKARSA
jgi:hypothetical protein